MGPRAGRKPYAIYREDVEECVDNPLHLDDFVCKKGAIPPGMPMYAHVAKCQALFVRNYPGKKEVTATGDVRGPSGPVIDIINEGLRKVGMFGDPRIGFTSLIKCGVTNRRYLAKMAGVCRHHLDQELRLVKPLVVVCLGEDVVKYVLPELWEHSQTHHQALWGRDFVYYDQTYFLMPDPAEYVNDKGEVKKDSHVDFDWEFIPMLDDLKQLLLPEDQYYDLMQRTAS